MQPSDRSRQLIEFDACLIKHFNDNMNDVRYITETIQYHHMAYVMSLLLLQRINLERFPSQDPQLYHLAH